MTQIVVPDSSAIIASLLDEGPEGRWARAVLRDAKLAAPELLWFEAANVLRRAERAIEPGQVAQAHADLADFPIESWPYAALAPRCWELRHNFTIYDASYVAVAELLGAQLMTLDRRMARATEPRCGVVTPPE